MSAKAARIREWSLMVRVGQGCNESFEQLYNDYHPRLVRFLSRRLSDSHTIESVASDTLMTARDKADQFFANSQLSTWLFGIAARKAMRAGERENRRQHAIPQVTLNNSVNGTNQVSRVRELGDLLKAGLGRLPEPQKRVVSLHLIEGYSLAETAEKLDLPLSTVKNWMFQARKRLKLQLQQIA